MGELSQEMDMGAAWERGDAWCRCLGELPFWKPVKGGKCAQSRAFRARYAIYLLRGEPIVLATFSYGIYI
jgi:hypothetical protein